jgi:drug/metabolite transporter (DMT)-like permease
MTALWILATLIAAAAQTARNATQAHLTAAIGTTAATQVRFLFGLPFALLFLGSVSLAMGEAPPLPGARALLFTAMGAAAQILATALMLVIMQKRSFAVTTAWLKTEPVMVALFGAVVLGDHLGFPAMAAIAVATLGVVLMSVKPAAAALMLREAGPAWSGIAAGALFGLAAVGFRGGILALPEGSFLIRASTILVLGLGLQVAMLLVWMLAVNRQALAASFAVWPQSLGAGFLGAFASQFWFIGFSLTSAANVRTLALVEVLMAQAVAWYGFRQGLSRRQVVGMALILLGVGVLLRLQA